MRDLSKFSIELQGLAFSFLKAGRLVGKPSNRRKVGGSPLSLEDLLRHSFRLSY
mgnify:CR=1 FL=1